MYHLNVPLSPLFAGVSLRFSFRCLFQEALLHPQPERSAPPQLPECPSAPCDIPITLNYNRLVPCHSLPTGSLTRLSLGSMSPRLPHSLSMTPRQVQLCGSVNQQPQVGTTATQPSPQRPPGEGRSQLGPYPVWGLPPGLTAVLPAPLHTAPHHVVTLTLSSQPILTPWPPLTLLLTPHQCSLGPALPSPGGLRVPCPSLTSGLFPEGKCFSFVQIKERFPR